MIDIASAIAGDLAFVDNNETITLVYATGSVSVSNAVGEDLSAEEASALGGLIDGKHRNWVLQSAPLKTAGVVPAQGMSVVQGDNTTWLVTPRVTLDALGVCYEVLTSLAR